MAAKDTFTIIVDVKVAADRLDEFVKLIVHDAEVSPKVEPGCLRFDILRDPENELLFTFYEVYANKEAFDYHLK